MGRRNILKGLIKQLGIAFNVENFWDRFKLQKIIYLIQLHPKIRKILNYEYNLYIYGPYSKELADDYYHLDNVTPEYLENIPETVINLVNELKKFSHRKLELYATTVDIILNNPNNTTEDTIFHIKILKPKYYRREIIEAIQWANEKINHFLRNAN